MVRLVACLFIVSFLFSVKLCTFSQENVFQTSTETVLVFQDSSIKFLVQLKLWKIAEDKLLKSNQNCIYSNLYKDIWNVYYMWTYRCSWVSKVQHWSFFLRGQVLLFCKTLSLKFFYHSLHLSLQGSRHMLAMGTVVILPCPQMRNSAWPSPLQHNNIEIYIQNKALPLQSDCKGRFWRSRKYLPVIYVQKTLIKKSTVHVFYKKKVYKKMRFKLVKS